jgi:hypothetical protein
MNTLNTQKWRKSGLLYSKGEMRTLIRQLIFFHVPALLFALVFQLPQWPDIFESVYGFPMRDREVYLRQIIFYDLPTDHLHHFDLMMYATYEWLWNQSLSYLNRQMHLDPEQIFSIITTLVIWRFTYEIASRAGWVYVIFLVNPLIIDFAFSQMRFALAMSLVSFFWRGEASRSLTVAGYVVASSIHTTVLLFAVMHFAAHWLKGKKIAHLFLLIGVGFAISTAIGPLRELILTAVGDRRAEYRISSSTFAYLSYWLALWTMLVSNWRTTMMTLDGRYAVIILSIVALNFVYEGYSTRFIAAAFPSLVVLMAISRSAPFSIRLALFIPYSILQWLYWLRIF